MRGAILVSVVILVFTLGVGQSDARMRQLPPSAFPELPMNLVFELQRRGCQIPQVQRHKRSNVIQGAFLKSGEDDWAVLCATKKNTSLLVFGNGLELQIVEIATRPNGFSHWSIDPTDSTFRRAQVWSGSKPIPVVDHQGIQSWIEFGDRESGRMYDYSAESTVLYYDQGTWSKTVMMTVN